MQKAATSFQFFPLVQTLPDEEIGFFLFLIECQMGDSY